MTPTREAVAGALDASADLLERDGWTQGDYGNEQDGWCAMGAIDIVTGMRYLICEMLTTMPLLESECTDALFASVRQLGWSSVVQWNDSPGRTKEDVVMVFRKTALTVRETVEP